MSQAQVLIDSAASATLSTTAVVPVLNGAVTGTGGAVAAQVTLADLKTFFGGGTANALILTTAIATPSAIAATQFTGFASTVSGATLMGFGTTGDVTLKNRAGTDVLVVTSNTLNVTLAGNLSVTSEVVVTGSTAVPAGTVRYASSPGSTATNLVNNVPTGGDHILRVAGSTVSSTTSTGYAVKGGLTVGAVSAAPATAASITRITKAVTAIPNNTATAILTATIPNATHSATIRVTVDAQLGAGGAIGAGEAYGTISYDYIIGRFAGAATTLVASSAYGSAVSLTAGGATITVTTSAGDLVGANNASQTFTIKVTIVAGSGSSTNHTATVMCEVLNQNATGITVA